MNAEPKVNPPSATQTVLGSWFLSIESSDGVPITALKNGSIELSAELPLGADAQSVQVVFLGGDGLSIRHL